MAVLQINFPAVMKCSVITLLSSSSGRRVDETVPNTDDHISGATVAPEDASTGLGHCSRVCTEFQSPAHCQKHRARKQIHYFPLLKDKEDMKAVKL